MARKQSGVVSITVTLVLMLVISLIVMGFAQVSRREQRLSLDRHLSTQAFFAAESGVNDAIEAMRNAPAGSNFEKSSCADNSENPLFSSPLLTSSGYTINAADQVSYTCLLVTTEALTLRTALANDGSTSALPLYPKGGTMSSIQLRWTYSGVATPPSILGNCSNSAAPSALTQNNSASWHCPYGLVRLDLVPLANVDRGSLMAKQKAFFLYPTNTAGAANHDFGATPAGSIRRMRCDAVACTVTISGLAANTGYGMRAMAVYGGGNLEVSAFNGVTPVALTNAQAQIDVTGKAQDVLRRVQVRVPLNANRNSANFPIESGSSVCKRFGIAPTQFVITGITGQDQSNPMCAPTS